MIPKNLYVHGLARDARNAQPAIRRYKSGTRRAGRPESESPDSDKPGPVAEGYPCAQNNHRTHYAT
jgi:hypothetical protein